MNDFTKGELKRLLLVIENDLEKFDDEQLELLGSKLQSLIDNYCEHENHLLEQTIITNFCNDCGDIGI